ncbi:SMP-30/gluconolactonase/LRE family protein [Brucella sp. MAB-22]|uniref:SMP-30/gluconolactonase/LRE family protein n=1 Tax=Brucella TaxID=234 RepID=UPI000F68CC53|nr:MULTISPECIES: SMP-30/gluconolactonase/LRE family protein [Brucella]RRY20414.1 SMP-30/gluconolactonase/LRE family protein [Brucella anthropi]UYT56707.1 SMP-30/gluconolactonase/LRE family protein [Brucella sp. MAB-22]
MTVVKTTLFADHVAELGEGPGYDPLSGNVWWFDILGQKLIEKNWDSGEIHVHALGMKASALAVIDRDRQLIVSEHGLFIRERANGRLTLHHPLEAENDVTRSNDARVHPSGSFWIGTMGKKAETDAGSIWWYREGQVKKLFSGITITNSICFSPDGKVAYFADTDRNIIWRVDTDPETGLPISDKSVFHHRIEDGGVDGSVVDAEGTLWNACWGGSSLNAYSSQGRLIRSISLPVRQPSCPAFVGPDATVMIVTSANEGLDEEARRSDPHAGKVLLLDLTLAGRHDPPVRL